MTLSDTAPTRKQRFNAALQLAGMSISEWCEANEVSRTHLYAVLSDGRDASSALNAAIDATIAKYLGRATGAKGAKAGAA